MPFDDDYQPTVAYSWWLHEGDKPRRKSVSITASRHYTPPIDRPCESLGKLVKDPHRYVQNIDDTDAEWLYDEAVGPPDPHMRRPVVDWIDDPFEMVCAMDREAIVNTVRRCLLPQEARVRSSINHRTIIAGLEQCGGSLKHPHGKCLDVLARELIRLPGNTLGENPPEVNRLIPSIEAMEKQGLITFRRSGRKFMSVTLTGKHLTEPPSADTDPEEHSATIIEVLAAHGGQMRDHKGYVTNVLIDALIDATSSGTSRRVWNDRIKQAEQDGWLVRHTGATRTYVIELSPLGRKVAGLPELNGASVAEPEALEDEEFSDEVDLDADPEAEDNPLSVLLEDEDVYDAVTTILAKIRGGSQSTGVLAENDQLRAQVSGLTKMASAMKSEVEDLTKLLKIDDDENARLRQEVEEYQRKLDKIGKERDELKRMYSALHARLTAYGLADQP
jgi:hypothetical protein